MSQLQQPRCVNPELAGFDATKAAEETWNAMLKAGVFVEGHFTFASGIDATLKADAERLYLMPSQLTTILGHFAAHPCVRDADVFLYVPDGMRLFMTMLGIMCGKPVANARKVPGSTSKYDFTFETQADRDLAHNAQRPIIGEDIVTTLGSVAALRKLLRPEQSVYSLAILLRGTVNPIYQKGLVDHYLLKKEIPTDKDDFKLMLAKGNF